MGARIEFVFAIVVAMVLLAVWLVGVIVFGVVFISELVRPSSKLKWIGGIGLIAMVLPALLGVGAIFYFINSVPPTQASDIVQLPPQATVLSVEPDFHAGDGTVVFQLTDTKSPEQWVQGVWSANGPLPKGQPVVPLTIDNPHHKLFINGEEIHELEYDPVKRAYQFKVRWPDLSCDV